MTVRNSLVAGAAAAAFSSMLSATAVQADETCLSPYMQKIIGHEDYIYVWTPSPTLPQNTGPCADQRTRTFQVPTAGGTF